MKPKYSNYENVLSSVKLLMPNVNENPNYDEIIDFTLTKVITDVSIYTNIPIEELPEELEPTFVSLAIQVLNTYELLVPYGQKTSNVGSLTEGDTSVTFRTPSEAYVALQNANTITDNYVNLLNYFRRVQL
ncbi:hypothetical protein [Lactobacillus sp. PSON]|uniref:hypothetical protein n=1 Tax=Lactobacillus sp. PSON TaxID=3455454 RepID=UPI0040423EA0